MITSNEKPRPLPLHPAWLGRKRGLELVPLHERDAQWEFNYFEAKVVLHQPCYQAQCSCHFPPGFDLTTGKMR
jgi:hypothetical protein